MSLQIIMKLDGVNGDSSSFKHKSWSDLLNWNWGMTSNRKSGAQSDTTNTTLNEMSVVKEIGNDSASLRLLFAQGKIIPFAEFCIFPKVGKREPQSNYLNIRLENVMIKSIVTGGGNEDDFFKEHLTLLFEKVKFEYNRSTKIEEDGSFPPGKEIDFEWDIPANEEWQH